MRLRPVLTCIIIPTAAGCLPELPFPDEPCGQVEAGDYVYHYWLDKERKARVYVPAGEGPRQMVVALHGAGGNGWDFMKGTGIREFAEQEGFIAMGPYGTGWLRTWNAGECCGSSRDFEVEDLKLLQGMTNELRQGYCVDRVLVAGASNGAMMAHRWACEGSKVEAIVAVSGTLEIDECVGDPVAVRMYHGTEDNIVPYAGGSGDGPDPTTSFSGIPWTTEQWKKRNLCGSAEPSVETEGKVTCETWDCAASTVLCTIEGGGHEWPTEANVGRETWKWFEGLSTAGDGPGTDTDEDSDR